MEGAANLVSNVGNLVGEELRQLRAVGGQVGELKDELAAMNAILRMHSEADDGAIDHFVREWMKQVRELAYDAEDCIHLYVFRIRCKRGIGVLLWSKRQIATLLSRRRLFGEITALHARAITISERHARYGVNLEALRCSPSSSASAPVAVVTSEYALRPADNPDQLVGISDQVNTLASNLRATEDMNLTVFSVVGFGGLGKTTLAVEVCRQLEADFQHHAQVSVSQAFDGKKDLKELLKQVLRQISKVKTEDHKDKPVGAPDPLADIDSFDVPQLAERLQKNLLDKRYLIVLDDIWTVQAWEAIQFRLPKSNCGSRIIVTTRMESVAKAASLSEERCIHRMEPLGTAASKKLFVNRVFGTSGATLPSELESITKSILDKCSGLPLAIVSIASILSGYKSHGRLEKWERFCSSIGSEMDSNPTLEGMRQLITLSYNYLPHHLKPCMLYLSIYPEDYEIQKNMLLYKWIAEGLIAEKRGKTLIEVAEEYFNELVGRNMIQPAQIDSDGSVETCRVHDMMLEVMVSKSLEANFVSLIGRQFIGVPYEKIRRLSVHDDEWSPNGEEEEKEKVAKDKKPTKGPCVRRGVEEIEMKHVRSLVIFKSEDMSLLDRLDEFKLLRVLDLANCKGLKDSHLKYVCRMYLLRFLNLSGTDITVIPPDISDLEHLQSLHVSDTLIHVLPEAVTDLAKLERLSFSNKSDSIYIWRPGKGLSKMKALRGVDKMLMDEDENPDLAREIGELEQLEDLNLYVKCSNSTILSQLAKSLSKVRSLRSLFIYNGNDETGLEFLLEMSPSPSLHYLSINGRISQLPDWVRSLTCLAHIIIGGTRLVDDQLYDVLCKLPNLKKMSIQRRAYTSTELVARSRHTFPALTYLSVSDPKGLQVIQFEEGSMAKLETFQTYFRGYERSIIGIEHLTSLKDVLLEGFKENCFLDREAKKLESVSQSRPKPKQFKVTVTYNVNIALLFT